MKPLLEKNSVIGPHQQSPTASPVWGALSPKGMHRVAVGNAHGPGTQRGPTLEGSHPESVCRGRCNPFRVGARALYADPSGLARPYVLRPFQGRNAKLLAWLRTERLG
jgi:hypothetical protein